MISGFTVDACLVLVPSLMKDLIVEDELVQLLGQPFVRLLQVEFWLLQIGIWLLQVGSWLLPTSNTSNQNLLLSSLTFRKVLGSNLFTFKNYLGITWFTSISERSEPCLARFPPAWRYTSSSSLHFPKVSLCPKLRTHLYGWKIAG